jgi:hypothetical protein
MATTKNDPTFLCGVCEGNAVDRKFDVCDPCESEFQEIMGSI